MSPAGGARTDDLPAAADIDRLTDDQVSVAVTRVLERQADPRTVWDVRWGDFIQAAHAKRRLSADDWRKYLLGSVVIRPAVAASARRSPGLKFQYRTGDARSGADFSTSARVREEDDIAGVKVDPYRDTGYSILWQALTVGGGGMGSGWTAKLDGPNFDGL